MQIKEISVNNFGPLHDVTLPCDNLTVLVGKNGVGKSTLIKALFYFYNTGLKIDERDFFNGEIEEGITIKITFSNLTELEEEIFAPYILNETLAVEKHIKFEEERLTERYYGTRFSNPDFDVFRNASGPNLRAQYNLLRETYDEFPPYQNKDLAEQLLTEWELNHKDECMQIMDDGSFFGFNRVGRYNLAQHTKFILIPAVHEAIEEAQEGSNSSITEMMNLVVMESLLADPEFHEIELEAQRKYVEFIKRIKSESLDSMGDRLTNRLNNYFQDSMVEIDWDSSRGVSLAAPRAFIKITEEGYQNTIDRCGHGLQRAFILTMFQELALIQTEISEQDELIGKDAKEIIKPNFVIGIEEPELYQHPDKQRHFANTLYKLSMGGINGVTTKIQLIYSTHSPLMLDYQRFNQIRIFKKELVIQGKPKETVINYANLRKAASIVERVKMLREGSLEEEAFQQSIISLMTPWMNEGFFSKLIVLVEGIKDRALIVGQALADDIDLESMGLSIIPCSGKTAMPEAVSIFMSLEIPLYLVWDADYNSDTGMIQHRDTNHNIMRCFGLEPEDAPEICLENCSCIKTDLENKFREEIGEINFNRVLQVYSDRYGRGRDVLENPLLVSKMITDFDNNGLSSETLKNIINAIVAKSKTI
jgi:predicted ATP-dependent endonuclease of OLD family